MHYSIGLVPWCFRWLCLLWFLAQICGEKFLWLKNFRNLLLHIWSRWNGAFASTFSFSKNFIWNEFAWPSSFPKTPSGSLSNKMFLHFWSRWNELASTFSFAKNWSETSLPELLIFKKKLAWTFRFSNKNMKWALQELLVSPKISKQSHRQVIYMCHCCHHHYCPSQCSDSKYYYYDILYYQCISSLLWYHCHLPVVPSHHITSTY